MAAKRKTKSKTKPKKASPIPKGLHTVTPYLSVAGCAEAIAFYVKAFGAKELFRLVDPISGRIGHAELKIGDSVFMLAEESPASGFLGPKSSGGCPVRLHLAVKDSDAVVARAAAAGATVTRTVREEFYGSRAGNITDPFGHSWMVSTQVKVVSPKQMQKIWADMVKGTKA